MQKLARRGIFVVLVHARIVEQGTLEAWINKKDVSFVSVRIASDTAAIRRSWRVKALPWLILTDSRHIVTTEGFGLYQLSERIDSTNNKQ